MPRSRSKSRSVRSRARHADNELYLLHTSFGHDNTRFLKILQSGFLKPSSETGAVGVYGSPRSKAVYTRIKTKKDVSAHFEIDYRVLLESKFTMHIGWTSEDADTPDDIIDGTKLTLSELKKMILEFKRQVSMANAGIQSVIGLMQSEIIIYNSIDLHKYLHKINIWNDEAVKYAKENYKNVTLHEQT